MKILVVCQYYNPEPVRITDICEQLVECGHDVTVLTDIPNYPFGNTYKGYGVFKKRMEDLNGVRIIRSFTIPRKNNILCRFLNYYSFSISSLLKIMFDKNIGEFDVVFCNQLSPVMMARAAIKYKKKYHKKLMLYCLDLWPESLMAGGIKKGSFIYNCYHRASKKIYNSCDSIGVTSPKFKNYLHDEFQIPFGRMFELPQYAENVFSIENCRVKDDKDTIDFMFAGNIGVAQSIDTILDAAKDCADLNVKFHIVGDGKEYVRLKKRVNDEKINNVIFYGRKRLDEMQYYYSLADAMLLTLVDNEIINYTIPGKLQTYLAAGKPVIGAINGAAYSIIQENKIGYASRAEDSSSLETSIRKFVRLTQNERNSMGERSYQLYLQHYSKSVFFETLEHELKQLVK